jgi:hypothetical protein
MALLSSMLSPEDLQKLIEAREAAPYLSTPAAPPEPTLPTGYSSIFNKPIAQDIVNQASVPGNSAAESAKVFQANMPENPTQSISTEAPTQNISTEAPTKVIDAGSDVSKTLLDSEAPTVAMKGAGAEAAAPAAEAASGGLLDMAGALARKFGLPLTVAYEALKSGPMGGAKEAYADENPKGPLFTGKPEAVSSEEPIGTPQGIGSKESNLFSNVSDQIKQQQKAGNVGLSKQEQEAEDEDEDETPSPGKPAAKSSPEKQRLQDLMSKAQTAQPRMNTADSIRALLGQQQDALQGAQSASNTGKLIAMLGQAGSTIGEALTPLAKEKNNSEYFKNLEQAAGAPVQNVLQQQASQQTAIKGALEKQQLQKSMDMQDPNSTESTSFRKSIEATAPWLIKAYGPDWQNVTASDRDVIWDPIKLKEQMDMRKEQAAANLQMKQLMFGKQSNDKQSAAQNQTLGMLESARGNPEVSGALRNKLLVKNAASLINQYPDPNNMSPQEVSLLVTEIGKIASGGVPAEKELQTIMPNTMRSNLASLTSKLTNAPTPANAGAFIKKYQSYLGELDKNSSDVINEKYNRVIEAQKGRTGNDFYNSAKQLYNAKPIEFKTPDSTNQYGDDVMSYAAEHGISPTQAQQIKTQRMAQAGGQ